jgi:hypothetical protein
MVLERHKDDEVDAFWYEAGQLRDALLATRKDEQLFIEKLAEVRKTAQQIPKRKPKRTAAI